MQIVLSKVQKEEKETLFRLLQYSLFIIREKEGNKRLGFAIIWE